MSKVLSNLRGLIPPALKRPVRQAVDAWRIRKAGRAWRRAAGSPGWLSEKDLGRLQHSFPLAPRMQYDPASLLKRGRERYLELAGMMGSHMTAGSSLELGCGDGMVSGQLRERGWQATAIDNSTALFDERARKAGVTFHEMDASRLGFDDCSFDLVFCYNTFEHFDKPDVVLAEIHRVLRPGGLLVAVFNPIYASPYGLHAYYSISVPYCQFLFEPAVLDRYCRENNKEPINYGMLNEWTPTMFRELWSSFRDRFEVLRYREQVDCSGLPLVWTYPSCFKGKTASFDDLYVSGMECFFRKKG